MSLNIKFKKVYLRNFFSFKEAEIDLTHSGYILVSGQNKNKDDYAKSNGSGKSSIWESILWCLTGETIRGTKQVVNQDSTLGTKVELDFILDENSYKIIRYKEDNEYGNNLKLYINNEDKSGKGIRDTEKLLENYLPSLNASLLGSVIILGQGLPQRFTNNSPAGRKEILERLSKSDFMIEDIKEKLSNRKTSLSVDLRKYEDTILSLESKKSTYSEQLLKAQSNLSLLIPKDWDTEISNLKSELDRICTDKYNKEEKLTEVQHNIQVLNEQLSKLETEYSDYQLKASKALHEKTEPIVQKKLQANFEKHQVYKEIEDAKKIKDMCPTCGQKIPDVHIIDTTEMEAKHKHLEELIENYSCQIQELKSEYSKADDEFVTKQKEQKQTILDNLNLAKTELNNINISLKTLTADIDKYTSSINKLEVEKNSFEDKQINLKKSIEDIENSLETLAKEILYNNIEKDNIKSRYEVTNKILTIATRDFRGFLLSEIITYINSRSKEYSQDIFETDKIDFVLDGNDINISYCNKQYENLSGGEKQKIDLIVQFSIRDMLIQFLEFSCNILVLDEIFDNLDDLGCQKVLDLITHKLTDLEGIYIVTHHRDIAIPYDKQIVVIKDENGESRINNE